MKLYTSYWYNVRFFPRNLICLSTVVWPPKYQIKDSTGRPAIIVDCPPLKPGAACEGLCDGHCANKHPWDCDFLKTYRCQLDKIDIDIFKSTLEHIAEKIKKNEGFEDVDFAFIVYEAERNKCSERQEILAWSRDNNLGIEEWRKENDYR